VQVVMETRIRWSLLDVVEKLISKDLYLSIVKMEQGAANLSQKYTLEVTGLTKEQAMCYLPYFAGILTANITNSHVEFYDLDGNHIWGISDYLASYSK